MPRPGTRQRPLMFGYVLLIAVMRSAVLVTLAQRVHRAAWVSAPELSARTALRMACHSTYPDINASNTTQLTRPGCAAQHCNAS
jgi:hypothetical protein